MATTPGQQEERLVTHLAERTIGHALEVAREVCGLDLAYFSEFRDGVQLVRRRSGPDDQVALPLDTEIPLEGSYCQRVVDGRLSGVIPDTAAEPEVASLPATAEAGIGAYVGVPLRRPDGSLYGSLCCAASTPQPQLDERCREVLVLLAQLVGEQLAHVEELARRQAEQRAVLGTVAHDLRSPLGAIRTLAEDLQAPEPLFDPVETGTMIASEADRVLGLAEEVLVAAREDAGVVHLDLVEADLRALAQQAARTCALAADEATDRLVLDLPEAPVLARVDARRLLPALQNLVGNALKYSPGGEPVTVHVREDGPTALVEVADRGIGIPADEVAHLGERFFRASTAAEHDVDGTGLGLATVLAVASAHEGTLAVDSIPGEGSTFRLRLPRRLS